MLNNDCSQFEAQLDDYLDNELSSGEVSQFLNHNKHCQSCGAKLHYARELLHNIEGLPMLDCDDTVLDFVADQTYARNRFQDQSDSIAPTLSRIRKFVGGWVKWLPRATGLTVPVLLLIIVLLVFYPQLIRQEAPVELAEQQYTSQEIRQALADFNLAVEYMNDIALRTEVMIGDRFLIKPLQESLDVSLDSLRSASEDLANDPI